MIEFHILSQGNQQLQSRRETGGLPSPTILPSEGMKAALLEKATLQRPRPLGRKCCMASSQ